MRMIRPQATAKKLSFSLTTLWRRQQDPTFPRAYRLGPNVVAFDEDEVDAWIASRRINTDAVAADVDLR